MDCKLVCKIIRREIYHSLYHSAFLQILLKWKPREFEGSIGKVRLFIRKLYEATRVINSFRNLFYKEQAKNIQDHPDNQDLQNCSCMWVVISLRGCFLIT